MEDIIGLLGQVRGRDKFIRTASYALHMIAGVANPEREKILRAVSSQLSQCRVILRLFDDLPMLGYTLSYGLGKHEKDPVLRVLSIIGLLSGQAYFPVEHVAWAADSKLISCVQDTSGWWIAGIYLWASGLVAGILRSIRMLTKLQAKINHMKAQRKLEASSEFDQTYKESMGDIRGQVSSEMLSIVINVADLMCAGNWIPASPWFAKFSQTQTGLFGTISSGLGLVKLFTEQRKAKLKKSA